MELFTTVIGAVLGGLIGYFFSSLQWKKSLENESISYKLENKRKLIELSYELIEYVRDYYCNSRNMEIGQFMASMSGRNPLKKVLAIVITNVPEMKEDATKLMGILDAMMGPEYPVPEDKYKVAINAANEFGTKALKYVKEHA